MSPLTSKTMDERLREALRDCIDYIELDSERPHFLFGAKALLLESSSETCDQREWVILHRTGLVPERKGPFKSADQTAGMLEALYSQHPDAVCDVVRHSEKAGEQQ